ncbi:MAG: hypothetical protein JNM91_13310, partial [Flavobacteriales bacterium]|nr:hypothetical protein [Flavobacteriales bacterium]
PNALATITIALSTPAFAGGDGSLTVCTTDEATDLIGELSGVPTVGGTWTAPDGSMHSGSFDPSSDVAGVYTYAVTSATPCPSDAAQVVITTNAPPDAGTDGAITLCALPSEMDLITVLNGTPDAGGAWTAPDGTPFIGPYDPSIHAAGDYTYTVSGSAPCPAASASVSVSTVMPPDAGSDGAILLCNASPVTDLFPVLVGTPSPGGTWSNPGGSAGDGTFDPAFDATGNYTYTVAGVAPCPNATAAVLVNVSANPDAGTPGSSTLCSSSAPVALLSLLGGTPDAGGTWTAPDGSAHAGTIDPAVDPAGTYIYNIVVPPPCVSASSTVSITIVQPANAGGDGALTLCSTGTSEDLFDALSGSPEVTGTWSYLGSAHNGVFDPAIDAPGTYTYSVPSATPCPASTANVEVDVNTPPDPGADGEAVLCISGAPVELGTFLGGTPDAGGTWTWNGTSVPSLLDPATASEGAYVYTVAGNSPCVAAASTVQLSIATVPDPGLDGTATICASGAALDLFTELEGTPDIGGSWSGPSVVVDGSFDPATMLPGIYTYLIAVPPPCTSVSSTVTINTITPPDPGFGGALALCITSPASSLFTQLGGSPDPGGTWTDPNGNTHSAFMNPAVDPSGLYTYTVAGTAPCPSASTSIDVNVVEDPDPGASSGATLCASDAPIDLFAQLGGTPDAGGSWSGPSAVVDGLFDPNTMVAGSYTYAIDVPPPCVSTSSTVTVSVVTPPEAGDDGSALFCISSPVADLFGFISGSPEADGVWTAPDLSAFSGSFLPGVDVSGVYRYTVNGAWPCPADTAEVVVSVVLEPDPGGPGFLTLCATDDPADLFQRLEGTPDEGGQWSGPSALNNGFFDPGSMLGGEYTYLLDAPEPCADASSTVTVTVVAPPDPGADGANTLCGSSDPVDLFAVLLGSPEPGGTWSAPGGGVHSGTFNPATDAAGTYVYTVAGDAPCPADQALVNVAVIVPPDAGSDGSITLCPDGDAVDLFNELGGTPDGIGAWSFPGGGSSTGSMDPTTDPEGTYTYTVNGTAPCANDQAVVHVEVSAPIQATTTTTDAICYDACDGTAQVTITGGTPGYTLLWSGNVAGSSDQSANGLCDGSYGINIVDVNGCTGNTAFVIAEPVPLVIDAVAAVDENCIGSCDGYVNVVDAEGVLFSIDGGSTWSSSNVIGGLCPGGYQVLMQDADGCLASAPAVISSPPPVVAAFYAAPDSINVTNTLVSFTNQSGNAQTFIWDFAGLGTSTAGNPDFVFPDVLGGIYPVCLTAINANGCTDSVCHPVVVLDELFFSVPNAFTPDGDGTNDGFAPIFNIPAFADDY